MTPNCKIRGIMVDARYLIKKIKTFFTISLTLVLKYYLIFKKFWLCIVWLKFMGNAVTLVRYACIMIYVAKVVRLKTKRILRPTIVWFIIVLLIKMLNHVLVVLNYWWDKSVNVTVSLNQKLFISSTNKFVCITKYQCKVCGYIYDPQVRDLPRTAPGTAFEQLPEPVLCVVHSGTCLRCSNLQKALPIPGNSR